jgi:hypothetical protein
MIIPIVSPLQAEPTKLCELHRHFTYDLMSIAGLSPYNTLGEFHQVLLVV